MSPGLLFLHLLVAPALRIIGHGKHRASAWQNAPPASSVPAMARGPGLALAEVAGGAFVPIAYHAAFYRLPSR